VRAAVVLAAGRGTRMRSDLAKVLHPLLGRPLVHWVLEAVAPLVDRTVAVVGHQREAVAEAVASFGARTAVQEPQEGTGHALACAAPELEGVDTLLVLAGDVPLIRRQTLSGLIEAHEEADAAATVLTFRAADPTGYGRIVRGADGGVERIVEQAEADEDEQRLGECNSGTWAFDAARVLPLLGELPRSAKGEYYLTDVVALLRARGEPVAAASADESEVFGINTPEQLVAAERELAARNGS
jgi:bifunctional UDP-N-acetylglucosamine pyrophosphorylase/glucosamine-1-phosphate N-acetyltransferase